MSIIWNCKLGGVLVNGYLFISLPIGDVLNFSDKASIDPLV